MNLNRLRLPFLFSSLAVTAFACGGIADPTRGGEGSVATVSGALTGTAVPANARVALVYRKANANGGSTAVEVGSDVPVVGGKFTMDLSPPSETYFAGVNASREFDELDSPPPPLSGGAAPADPDTAPRVGSSGGGKPAPLPAANVRPQGDPVSGGITQPLTAAIAGFVVYADANGNGKLDLEGGYASSPDQILGGKKDLILVYFRDGGTLDYEKLRDKSGILPGAGFNLAWTEGRWFPLSAVELQLSASPKLPRAVCSYSGSSSSGSGGSSDTGEPSSATPGAPPSGGSGSGPVALRNRYPAPGSPGLNCSPDGRSYSILTACPPPPPPPVGLCASDYDTSYPCAGGYGETLANGTAVPEGWPCPVNGLDGGSADAGSADAGTDGAIDGGSADAGSR